MAGVLSRSAQLHQPGWLSGAVQLVILGIAAESESAAVWPYAMFAVAGVSFFAWMACHRRYRQIHDLPTSRIGSAAQGYVELVGRTETLGHPVASRLSGHPCCWFRFQVEEKDDKNRWRTVEEGSSADHFLLVDGSGQCVISPDGAEVLTHDRKTWSAGHQRYTEWLLLPKTPLYAIGEFSTTTAAAAGAAADERADVGALVGEWKRDRATLHQRFDLNRDGAIDMMEWELARREAQREVRRRRAALPPPATEGVHLLRKPADGRLFLLANEMPDKLGARYRYWSWLHLAVFFAAGGTGIALL